jgi:tRNA pseudouridine55 synthase
MPDGILNLDKPRGLTSHDVVACVRALTGVRRVGHAGTLDPLAAGVLLLCIGRATRVSEYLMAGRKTYRARVRLGVTTDRSKGARRGQSRSGRDSSDTFPRGNRAGPADVFGAQAPGYAAPPAGPPGH